MSRVTVDPRELDRLARVQEGAAHQAGTGAKATHDLSGRVWQSHGVVSHASNTSLTNKETKRETAGKTLKQACLTLAAALRAAANDYEGADKNSAQHISNQA